MAKAPTKRRYAAVEHPTIEAVIHGLFRFENAAQALERLHAIRSHFIIAKDQPPVDDARGPALKLWITGYALSEAQIAEGYLGHWALIRLLPTEGERFTLKAEKINLPLNKHPQRRRPKQRHPDWGFPLLREVKRGLVYESIDKAQSVLVRLHEAFPDVSIPGMGKLYLMIYGKLPDTEKSGVQKYVFELQAVEDGGVIITYRLNTHKPRRLPTKRPSSDPAPEPSGYFTTKVALKRKPKK